MFTSLEFLVKSKTYRKISSIKRFKDRPTFNLGNLISIFFFLRWFYVFVCFCIYTYSYSKCRKKDIEVMDL